MTWTVILSALALKLGIDLASTLRRRTRERQIQRFYEWRDRQQSKWRVKYPSVKFDEPTKWDGDIPVFAQKEKK